MKRNLLIVLVLMSLFLIGTDAKTPKKTAKGDGKTTVPCPTQKKLKGGINACPDTGCGRVDPLLNKQKNIDQGNPDSAEDKDFSYLAGLDKKVAGYDKIGSPRNKLQDAGEGKMIRIVAWALEARPQKTGGKDKNGKPRRGESCNCGFTGVKDPQDTDVHIVLVDDDTLKLRAPAAKGKTAAVNTLKKREARSQTAEYTPRVRVARHEEFDGAKLKTLINAKKRGRLLVRVTGVQMYDSEHALGPHKLLRRNDWEIHPVFRLEFCPKGKTCENNQGWIDINK